MTVIRRTPVVAIANPLNVSGTIQYLHVVSASVAVDERSVPMYTLDATVVAPTPVVEAMLDPSAGNVLVVSSEYVSDPSFTRRKEWNGVVADTSRNGDGTLRIVGVSPDTRLIEYAPAADDATCKTMQSDVRLIWRYVISKVFGPQNTNWTELVQPTGEGTGVPLTPFPTFEPATNMIANGGFESGAITGWTPVACTASAVSGSWSSTGAYAIRLFPNNSSSSNSYVYTTVQVEPNTTYTVSATLRVGATQSSGVDAAARRILITGTVNGQGYELARSAQGAQGTNATTRLSRTFTTPAVLDSNQVLVRLYHGQNSSSFVGILWDDVLMVEGDGMDTDTLTPIPYFDGDTANGTAGYNYAWQSTAKASAATRTPIIDRAADVLTWMAGQSAYDFLQPIMEAFGYRSLAYDSYTTPPNSTVPGPIFRFVTSLFAGNVGGITQIAQGQNLYSLDTGQSRGDSFPDGTPLFADAVILRYTWRDSTGTERTAIDAYTPAGYVKPYYVELAQPYPGPGRAVSLFNRLVARRRTYRATYRLNINAQPGMQVSISSDQLPGGSVLGQADTVEHDLVAGTTTITTKNTIAYPTSGWLRVPAGESWNASPTGASWTAETLS